MRNQARGRGAHVEEKTRDIEEATADFTFTTLTAVFVLQSLPSSPLIPIIPATMKHQQKRSSGGEGERQRELKKKTTKSK